MAVSMMSLCTQKGGAIQSLEFEHAVPCVSIGQHRLYSIITKALQDRDRASVYAAQLAPRKEQG